MIFKWNSNICKIVVDSFIMVPYVITINSILWITRYAILFLFLIIKRIQTLEKKEIYVWNQIKISNWYKWKYRFNTFSSRVELKMKKFSQLAIKPLFVSIISTVAFLRVNSLCVRFPCTVAIRTGLPRFSNGSSDATPPTSSNLFPRMCRQRLKRWKNQELALRAPFQFDVVRVSSHPCFQA